MEAPTSDVLLVVGDFTGPSTRRFRVRFRV